MPSTSPNAVRIRFIEFPLKKNALPVDVKFPLTSPTVGARRVPKTELIPFICLPDSSDTSVADHLE
ncbi:hypothetical protein [Paraburkholderia sp. J67]|uniref:hypothetical protein n=1 Tax=Paraburkholderia sp. J67 TaxID=2805435 RepID=UPI002ABD3FC9|nr:hypothetical protein [Paraburkholderia sp. J67]